MKKMRRFFSVLMIGTLSLVVLSGMSAVFGMEGSADEWEIDPALEVPKPVVQSGDYGYQINDDNETVTIAEYYGSDQDIVIPEELDGYVVTAIGYQAFTYLEMKSLTIPETVESIGMRAFEYCTISKQLVLPEQITVMGDAFSYALLPQVVSIPDGAVLKDDAFSYNEKMEILCIGSGVTVGESAFGYSEELAAVVIADGTLLEDDAFEYTDSLEQVVLCGDVQMEGEPFSYCKQAKISQAGADDYAIVMEALQSGTDDSEKTDASDGLKPHGWFNQ